MGDFLQSHRHLRVSLSPRHLCRRLSTPFPLRPPPGTCAGSGGGRAARVCSAGRGGLGPTFAAHTQVRALLAALGIPCIDAEGEAEATCAALVAAGSCHFVASSDFDALLFGAPRVLRSLNLCSGGISECELWDADAIERLTGLDHHPPLTVCRLPPSSRPAVQPPAVRRPLSATCRPLPAACRPRPAADRPSLVARLPARPHVCMGVYIYIYVYICIILPVPFMYILCV